MGDDKQPLTQDVIGTSWKAALNQIRERCASEIAAYSRWLGFLSPLRWVCIGGGVIFSAGAGFTALWQSIPHGRFIVAGLSFAASALTGLHIALKCDAYQAECHRLVQSFKVIELDIDQFFSLPGMQQPDQALKIATGFRNLIDTASVVPGARWYKT
jgi:hypothetical protein